MASLNFNAMAFNSQQLPEPLPGVTGPADNIAWPVDCNLTDDQKTDFGKHSEFVGLMDTVEKVIRHWELVAIAREQQQKAQEALTGKSPKGTPGQREELHRLRMEHANVVNQARQEWRDAVKQRADAMRAWDAFVKQKHEYFSAMAGKKIRLPLEGK